MRVQTTFEKIAQGASQKVFAACFVALRVAFGVACLYLAFNMLPVEVAAEPGTALYDHEFADQRLLTQIYAPFIAAIGLSFLLGLFVRPVSGVCILLLIFFSLRAGSVYPERTFLIMMVAALGFGLFASGGSSHALGLDGIISRNIRRPNVLTKFLFS